MPDEHRCPHCLAPWDLDNEPTCSCESNLDDDFDPDPDDSLDDFLDDDDDDLDDTDDDDPIS